MKDADKNRDPERAAKRAKSDARCALKKLDLLETLRDLASGSEQNPCALAADCINFVSDLARELEVS